MIYSLTDKLDFSENPKIEIKGKTITVQADAKTVLSLMDIVTKQGELEAVKVASELLFNEKDRKIIDGFHLSMNDYSKLITTAIALATGEDPDAEKKGE